MTGIFIALECVLAGFWALSFLWDRRISRPPAILKSGPFLKWFLPAGRILSSRKKKISEGEREIQQRLKRLYPSSQIRQLYEEFCSQRAGQIFAALLICNSLLIYGLSGLRESQPVGYSLQRPLYLQEDLSEVLVVEGKTFGEEKILVTIPRQHPTKEQAEELLNQCEQNLRNYFTSIGTITGDLFLPTIDTGVQIRYICEGPFTIQGEGTLHLRLEAEGSWDQDIQAELICGNYSRTILLSVPVSVSHEQTPKEQIEAILAQNQIAQAGQTEMELPEKVVIDGEEEILTWKTPDQRQEAVKWILLLWTVPLLIFPLRSQEILRAEKIRKQKIQQAYPVMIHKLTVLLGAGLSITAAWDRIAARGGSQNPLIEEMHITMIQMHHGLAPQEALRQFGARVGCPELRKLANMLCRNLRRGDEFLLEHLKEMNDHAWEEHKKQVKIQSEEADTKLLIPMILMMLVVLIIVLTPALLSMNY